MIETAMADPNTILLGVNTVSTLGLVFAVGMNWGDYKRWRAEVNEAIAENKTSIAAIHQQDIRNVTVDSQMKSQERLIALLGKRTHDLRNVLQVAKLVAPDAPMSGFDEPIAGGAGD